MSVSGNQETGVKPSVGQFSEYSAGIPLKKRRHLIWPLSQPTEDSPSLPRKNDSEQQGFSSPLQGSAISNASGVADSSNTSGVLASSNIGVVVASSNTSDVAASSDITGAVGNSNDSGVAASLITGSVAGSSNLSSVTSSSNAVAACSTAASVSGISDAKEKTVIEKENESSDGTNGSMMQGNSDFRSVKLEEQSFTVNSRYLADMDSKGKLVATGESENILQKPAKPELDFVGNDSLTLNIGKDLYIQQNADGKCRSESSIVSGKPGLSLGFKEHLASSMAGGNSEYDSRNQEKSEPVSLNLSLSKGEGSTQHRSNDVQPNTNGAKLLADRSNWDLNTTMDAWVGPANSDGACKKTTHVEDIKPLLCSVGMTSTSMPTQQLKKLAIPSILSSQQYNTEDTLRLGLTTPCPPLNPNEKPSSSSLKADLQKVLPNVSLPGKSVPVSNSTKVNLKPVKSEPPDESIKTNSAGVKANLMGASNTTQVKHELVGRCSSENSKSSTLSTFKLVDARSVKPEPVLESNQETLKRMEGSLNRADEQDTTALPSSSTDLSLHADVRNHAEHSIEAKKTEPSGEGQVASKMVSSAGHNVSESNISGTIDNSTPENKTVEDSNHCRQNFMNVQVPESRVTVEGPVSDEEKINLSGDILEEDSYGSDYESDGNRNLPADMDVDHKARAEDDFEDGEVREPVENTEVEAPISEGREVGIGSSGDTGNKNSDSVGLVGDSNPSSSFVDGKESQREDPAKTNNDITNECIDTSVNEDSNKAEDREACLHEPSASETPSTHSDKTRFIDAMPRNPLDVSEDKGAVEEQEGDQTSIQASDTSKGTSTTIAQGVDEAKKTDSEGRSNMVLPNAEAFISGDDAGKDVNSGGNRSRIIDLSRASNRSSPGRTRSFSGRTLQSRAERERLPDVALEGDKFHPRGRDEVYGDTSHRFSRERHQNQPSRNPRISYMRGRGRISGRINTLRGDRDSERNFASEFYNGPAEFRVVRHKYASAVSDADPDSSYNNGQDAAYFGTGRGGRKMLSDDSSIFPHLPPRRRSPSGRDGPAARGLPMVRRVPRNLSPSRCIGEDGSEVVGLRNMRGFADDHTEPIFARSQPSYEGLDGPFVRGNREFSSVQRRGVQRIRSKSPTRTRTRSPGPWPSRRSPDGFGGPMELPHRRSPPIYRIERPDRPCFAGDMVARRHGSPPYLSRPSNDLRDMDPGRDHGHPRPGIPNRSPSGRILLRNNRRMDLVDPRERNDGDDYFGGPMPSGRFHELGIDGNADERRRYVDRRGPIRPFRPPYSGADSENFHLNAEGGPRSFRFCPEDDSELHERGNLRGREFDRQIKNRPATAPRRTRNIEEQEGNFRHGGQVWHDDGFDDMSRVKRKRF